MSSLSHHGIKGQKWGVRRFQNKDGTRTALGRKRQAAAQNVYKNQAANMLSEFKKNVKAKGVYGYEKTENEFLKHIENSALVERHNAYVDILNNENEEFAREALKNYYDLSEIHSEMNKMITDRRKTVHSKALDDDNNLLRSNIDSFYKEMTDDQRRKIDDLEELTSIQTMEKKEAPTRKVKYTSIGGTMYIEGNALILGDSSYLEHHGIRGQRWGIRRFQNRDGSLTNAGRKRLGYATKGAVQTVGKAFKAGVKAGGNAVKAVKAHHEEAEAKKKEKKKEKASQSRLGVLANKDLFTDDELRALNQRFKVEDELKMASIQKGVEIAKAVGTIASNAATAAKAYEDITGQSLSPIKRQAAELKKQQDAEDRARKIASEDAEEARKAAQEERNIKKFDQELRKATADADKEEFLAKKTKAQADQEILKALKGARDFDKPDDDDDDPPKPPSDSDDGSSWVQKATAGGKNVFEQMKYDSDPEYRAAKDAHDEKVARKERMDELDRREKERQAEKEAKDQALRDMINQSNARTGRGQSNPAPTQTPPESTKTPRQDSDALFSQKGSLPIDKDRYRNRKAAEKAKQVKEDAAEERAKKQDEKAVNRTIDDTIEANRSFKETVRAQDPHAYDRGVAKDYIKGKLNNLPNTLADLNPINRAAKKIADKATKEEEAQVRKSMKDQYDQMVKNEGRDEANYVMYNTRVTNLQAQGYSERKAKQIADSNPTFSAKRNRKKEYYEKVGELESTHRKNAEELHKANKELTDYYYKLVNGPGYEPGSPKREALDRTYRQKRGELEKLEKDNNDMLDREKKKAKKILEHSFSIQNGVLFIDSSDSLAHHGIKGQRWGVRRFQNPDGTLTAAGKKRDARRITKELNKNDKALAWEHRHISDRTDDYERWDKKAKKAENKGNLEKAEKFKQKRDETSAKLEEHRKNAKSMGEKTVSLISEATKKGYDIKTKDTRRSVNTGGEIAANIALNVLASAAGSPVLIARRKYIEGTKYKVKVKHDAFTIQDGILFINAGEPYLEHHGVLGMKWGKHLRAGKGPADAPASSGGGGGGAPEEDEETKKKIEEAAKKAGMSVAEFRTKMASKLSGAAAKAKKEIGYAYGSEYKKDFERAARLHENNSKSMREQAKAAWEGYGESRTAAQKDNWKRYAEYDRQAKASGNMFVKRERSKQAYDNSLASKVDSAKRKARLTKDRLKSALGKSKQRKQLSTEGPKAKKKVRIESASAMGFSTNNPYSIPVDARRWGYNATNKSRVSVGKRGDNMPKTALNPKHTDTSHRKKSVGEVMNNARNEQTPGSTPIPKPTQYTHTNRPRGREKYFKLGQESKGVKKRSRRVKHFDGSDELYTEGTRLVIHPKSITPLNQDYLEHHGILGQKWGIRRFQNKDGTRTAAGKKRYPNYTDAEKLARSAYHDVENGNYESAAKKYLESNRMPRYDSTGKELPRKTDNECISSFRVEVEEMRSNALSDLAVRIDTERKLARGEHVKSIFENDPDCKKMISALKEWEEESLTTADQFKQVSNIMRTMTNDRKETDRTKSDTMRMETLQEHQIEILDEYDLWGHPEYNDNRYSW